MSRFPRPPVVRIRRQRKICLARNRKPSQVSQPREWSQFRVGKRAKTKTNRAAWDNRIRRRRQKKGYAW